VNDGRKIDRTPGRLVVSSLISLYLAFFSAVASMAFEAAGHHGSRDLFGMLAGLFASACLPLILFAILLRLISK
jgi:hypothetical protein